MPKVSRETASQAVTLEGLTSDVEHLEGGYSVCFESHSADADLAELFRGLPDDRCQLPRWGYVLEGMITFRFEDSEETYVAGTPTTCRPATHPSTTPAQRSSSSAQPRSWARRSPWSWRTCTKRRATS